MPNGMINPASDYVAMFCSQMEIELPTIMAAHAAAIEVQELLLNTLRPFTSSDVDVVVFGSLARREWTSGSDVDWTMLIDGQAASQHRAASREVQRVLSETEYPGVKLHPPGAEGIFGNMAFSHEMVHHIGGQADTNRNTTQRILLLLEATALRTTAPNDELEGPYARIVRQVLERYLLSDSNFHSKNDQNSRIPRFLLNDIVRYWRTMCVDFAYKDWEQAGSKWAIRNIKLRTSRKLLFVSGLLMVFSCYQNSSLQRNDENPNEYLHKLQKHLLSFAHSTPLNIFVWTMQDLGLKEFCRDFLVTYEAFLSQINNEVTRTHLGSLNEKDVYADAVFLQCRQTSHDLQSILKEIFFKAETPLQDFIFEYGVF